MYHQEGQNYVTAYDLRNENMQFAVCGAYNPNVYVMCLRFRLISLIL